VVWGYFSSDRPTSLSSGACGDIADLQKSSSIGWTRPASEGVSYGKVILTPAAAFRFGIQVGLLEIFLEAWQTGGDGAFFLQ